MYVPSERVTNERMSERTKRTNESKKWEESGGARRWGEEREKGENNGDEQEK